MNTGLFQIRLYESENRDASRFKVVIEIEMSTEQAYQVNKALCLAKADIRFFPIKKSE